MTPYFKLFLITLALSFTSCAQDMLAILDGATHAKGSFHVEGVATDSEGDIDVCKVPDDYTPEQAAAYCDPE